jgi:hypothetical protein
LGRASWSDPIFCEYGVISIEDRTFVSADAVMLDVAPIVIGAACQIATRVERLTATHPVDRGPAGWAGSTARRSPSPNVWLGGGVIVCPGLSIGEDAVVGAAAVVTRTFPQRHPHRLAGQQLARCCFRLLATLSSGLQTSLAQDERQAHHRQPGRSAVREPTGQRWPRPRSILATRRKEKR